MKIRFEDDLDLLKIADSGQCFRWKRIDNEGGPAACRIIAGGRVLFLAKDPDSDTLDLSCGEEEYEEYWGRYLDRDTDYAGIRALVKKKVDPFLSEAAENGKGIRILFQDPFETLISFIISQRKNIPAISSSIEKLCRLSGERISLSQDEEKWLADHGFDGEERDELFAFPSAEAILKLSHEEITSCGTGYRTPYIREAAKGVLSGEIDLEGMGAMEDEDLFQGLLKIYGVGKKVASCVSLFGFHRLDFFPIDVWIERVLNNHYPSGFPFSSYRPYNGVMQQYMFFSERGKLHINPS